MNNHANLSVVNCSSIVKFMSEFKIFLENLTPNVNSYEFRTVTRKKLFSDELCLKAQNILYNYVFDWLRFQLFQVNSAFGCGLLATSSLENSI